MKNRDKFYYPAWKHALPFGALIGVIAFGLTYVAYPEYAFYTSIPTAAFVFVWEYIAWTKILNKEID